MSLPPKLKDNIFKLKIVNQNEFNDLIDEYNDLSKQNIDFIDAIYRKNPNMSSDEYIAKSNRFYERDEKDPKLIAFYLPQFHTIKENDEWWGKGFTEWTNVTKAQPQYIGHYQPHLPDELGFYDLSTNDIIYKQVEFAKKYGIYGFCFHYYWFSGKRLLEKPIINYLNDKNIDFPFMLCWANEPWSRRWDGSEDDILMPQNFGKEDYIKFIEDILPFFNDERYIKIDNCPILIIYRPHFISKNIMNEAIEVWNDYLIQKGFNGLYLINTRTGGFKPHPYEWGFDATVEFPPNQIFPVPKTNLRMLNPDFNGRIYNLPQTIEKTENLPPVDYPLYKTVFPAWDNTARKKNEGTIFHNSSPELYKRWLYNCILETKEKHPQEKHFVFINAWNEWAEGTHLEPDRKYGFAYLEATLDALEEARNNPYRYDLSVFYRTEDKNDEFQEIKWKINKFRIKNPLLYIFLKSKGNIKKFWVNKRAYNYLKKSDLFDEEFYLKNYKNIKKSGMDPLIHYLLFGYQEGKIPSAKFDGNHYLNTYPNVKKSGMNPLVHYVLYGKNEGKIIKSSYEDYKFVNYSAKYLNNIISAFKSKRTTIILYINNDFEDTEKCISNILENTKNDFKLIFIDDHSTDNRIKKLLEQYEKLEYITIRRNQEKLGFFNSIYPEIKNSKDDVVLVKSNVKVTPHWLQKLLTAAYSKEKIGTVSPLSNSYPFVSDLSSNISAKIKQNKLPLLIEIVSEHLRPEIGYPNESCIFIKKEVFDDLNMFNLGMEDVEGEKDFYLKISDKDWEHVLDDSTYVIQLPEDNPHHTDLISEIKILSENIKEKSENISFIPEKNILYVLHENIHGITGGTGQTTKDLVKEIDNNYGCYILVSSDKELNLWKSEKNQTILLKSWKIRTQWSVKEFYNPEFESIYFQILIGLNIDILHIQHLIGHTFDLAKVANLMGIPTILSLHDFYYICPSIHLLDQDNRYCAGQCTKNSLQCQVYQENKFKDIPLLKDFIDIWREEVSLLIDNVTAFTAPTLSTLDLYSSIYPQIKNKYNKAIEHGRDFKKESNCYTVPSEKPLKILVPGTIKPHKGQDFIKELKEMDSQNRIEFHFMGSISKDLKDIGQYHGMYKREDFCKLVNTIKPSFIGIFSICPETYCHTLSEAWSCGVPVLVTKLGALKERVEKTGGGYLLDPYSPKEAYEEIIRLSNSIEDYKKITQNVSNIKFKSLQEMVNEYEGLYSAILSQDID